MTPMARQAADRTAGASSLEAASIYQTTTRTFN